MSTFAFLMLVSVVASGVYLVLSTRYADVLLGFALLSNGINLLLIESSHPEAGAVDPLPQALILTAIVIGFALIAFLATFILTRVQQNDSDTILDLEEEGSE